MSDEKVDLIYDLLKAEREESALFRREVRDSHKKTDERLQKIETETTERLSKIEALDEVQNSQLAEHIRRTDILEDLHKDNEKRIVKLEEPGKVMSALKKWLITGGTIATAAAAIAKLFGLF